MNKLSEALLEHLGLNPDQITQEGFQVELGPNEPVLVRWQGIAYLTVEEFQRLVDESGVSVSYTSTS